MTKLDRKTLNALGYRTKCEICGNERPNRYGVFRQAWGRSFKVNTTRGYMCKQCSNDAYRREQGGSLKVGWRGWQGKLFNPLVIARNLYNYIRFRSLQHTYPAEALPLRYSIKRDTFERIQAREDELFARLAGGVKPIYAIQDFAAEVGVSKHDVAGYIMHADPPEPSRKTNFAQARAINTRHDLTNVRTLLPILARGLGIFIVGALIIGVVVSFADRNAARAAMREFIEAHQDDDEDAARALFCSDLRGDFRMGEGTENFFFILDVNDFDAGDEADIGFVTVEFDLSGGDLPDADFRLKKEDGEWHVCDVSLLAGLDVYISNRLSN